MSKTPKPKIVLTNGCFDSLHEGHLLLFKQARSYGDLLLVAINTDESIRRLKGPRRPVVSLQQRLQDIMSTGLVTSAFPFHGDSPLPIVQAIRPDVLVKGGDWSFENIIGAQFVSSYGGEVIVVPRLEGYSTSEIARRMRNE